MKNIPWKPGFKKKGVESIILSHEGDIVTIERRKKESRIYPNDPKFSNRYVWANSADPDQTAPREAV